MSFKNFFSKNQKTIDDVIFSVSVSNFADLALEAKIEITTGLGLGLGKILRSRSRSWSRTSRSQLQPWELLLNTSKVEEAVAWFILVKHFVIIIINILFNRTRIIDRN